MSSRELTEWMVYFAYKDKVQAIVHEQGDKIPRDQVVELAWQAFDREQ
jgi:hypothetical protein